MRRIRYVLYVIIVVFELYSQENQQSSSAGPSLTEITNNSLEITKAIHEYGLLTTLSSVFTIISIFVLVCVVVSFFILVRKLMKDLKSLKEYARKTMEYFNDKAMREVSLDQVKSLVASEFEHVKGSILTGIVKIKNRNNLADRESVLEKIDTIVNNLYDSSNNYFRKFDYEGNAISCLLESAWKTQAKELMMRDCETVEVDMYSMEARYNELFKTFMLSIGNKLYYKISINE